MKSKISFTLALATMLVLATGGSWAAIINVPADQLTIQLAVDVAESGDTINVAGGTYFENVVIDKQIILQGAGSGVTTIDASGGSYGITILSGGASDTQRLIIRDLHVTDAGHSGIYVKKSLLTTNRDYITIEDTLSDYNGDHGIRIDNAVVLNDFELKNSQLNNNASAGFNTESNTIVSTLLIIDSNLDSNKYGMYLEGTIDGVTILRTTFNNQIGGYGGYMTETGPLTNFFVEDCEFNNSVVGLMVWNYQDNGGITIRNTSFQDNAKYGVIIHGNSLFDVLIEECTVQNNDGLGEGYYGIDFAGYNDLMTNVAVHCTNITGHDAGGGVKNRSGVETNVDATNNWWGHASGPEGSGDGVFGYVVFEPWLNVEAPCPPSVLAVEIDIKPDSDPNSINLGSKGNVPVAIFSTPDFDATTINPTTVTLAGASVKLKGKGTPMASFEDVNGDTLLDIIVHIDTTALEELSMGDMDVVLNGETYDDKKISGVDTVRIVRE